MYVLNDRTIFFLPYDYQKYAEFYADFKSVEIHMGKKCLNKKLSSKDICKLVV
jgi:hypothetical protein